MSFCFYDSLHRMDLSLGFSQCLSVTSRQFFFFKCKSAFCGPRVPPPNPTTHHSHPLISPTSLLSFGRLSLFFLSFSLFSFYWNTHTHSPTSLHSKPHHLTIIFLARSPEKYLGTPKHLHHFIWGKSSNLFYGYYVLVWGYFTQTLIMLFMWFKSFGNDFHVFIYMGFGLGGCIGWVSSWFLQWWLSKACYGENLEVLSYNMW